MTESNVTNIKYLFDRPCRSGKWNDLLEWNEADRTAGVAQVVSNWRMDHRVSVEQQNFLDKTEVFSDKAVEPSSSLPQLARTFHSGYNCRAVGASEPPPYCNDANRFNRIDLLRLNPSTRLVHLSSLNRLLRFSFRWGAPGRADLESFIYSQYGIMPPADPGNGRAHSDFCDRLAARLSSAGEEAIGPFAELIADSLGSSEPHWWACFSADIDEHLEGDDWSDARNLLGLGHLYVGEWLLAWRYPVNILAALYRPSVLEAVDNGFHFSSPHAYTYGLCMPLKSQSLAIPEVIHAPLKGEACREFALGRIGRISRPYATIHNDRDLSDWYVHRRQEHRELLTRSFPAVAPWLARHPEPQ